MTSKSSSVKSNEPLDTGQRALLYEILADVSRLVDFAPLIRIIIAKAKHVLDAESAAILLLDRAVDELYFPFIDDIADDVEARFRNVRFPADRGIAGWVLRNSTALLVPDVRSDPRWYPAVDLESGMRTDSLLCAPLRGHRATIGVIQLRNKISGAFSPSDLALLEALANAVAIMIENFRTLDEVRSCNDQLQAEVAALRRNATGTRFSGIIGTSKQMQPVFQLMESASASPVTVLLQGETGTGKEIIARAIHDCGIRRNRPFLAVNCAAISDTLLESELFGHRRGAFTGAINDRKGIFETADGGTVFLDEVGDMSAAMQVKLLRVLQEGELMRVGEAQSIRVDVRVMSATNRDLEEGIRVGTFRSDLYYRLSTFPIEVPPLRERREDIPALALHLLQQTALRFGKNIPGLTAEAMSMCEGFAWPGNVRELRNEIERAVALTANGGWIDVPQLSSRISRVTPVYTNSVELQELKLKAASEAFEREFLLNALARSGGNVTATARTLGISRAGLHQKILTHGIERSEK